jgi:deoxyadenosine/deoxycytidine kinase
MSKLIVIVGASGTGKTTLARALVQAHPFETAFEQHNERPFQALFKQEARFALANQLDYLLFRAEQERDMRASTKDILVDGGLDLDFHGFTRLFHAHGFLTDPEFDLCRRFYVWTRSMLPPPDLVVALGASGEIIRERLAARDRINIASGEDAELFNSFLDEWLETLHPDRLLRLDVSVESPEYPLSIPIILRRL